jgi:hypothetical protein
MDGRMCDRYIHYNEFTQQEFFVDVDDQISAAWYTDEIHRKLEELFFLAHPDQRPERVQEREDAALVARRAIVGTMTRVDYGG